MSFTYDPDLPTALDQVRFLSGDKVTPGLNQDEEIAWILTQETNVYYAAALACESIASSFGQSVTKSVGGLSISFGEQQAKFEQRAKSLRSQGDKTSAIPVPISTAQSKAEKVARRQDTDLNMTPESIDQFRNTSQRTSM